MIVGVYGTLKKGQKANGLLGESSFIKETILKIPYQMYDLGSFPGLVSTPEDNEITVELYKINEDTEKKLDSYEGYPSLYIKEQVESPEGKVTLYVLNGAPWTDNIINSGNWK